MSMDEFKDEVKADYKLACLSREASIIGRKEVLTGKAKFGIFGDGKEVPQIAMAKTFRNGDFRSGYYRDQTFMFAAGMGTVEQFFAQLYADSNLENDPFSGGRQMNAHFATRSLDENGEWKNLTGMKNSSADTSPTASQMARALGLALASKKYREQPDIEGAGKFSRNGDEVTFCTIGDASTSEGIFWETLNAAAVMQVPLAVSVWDDGYGISVPIQYQTVKTSISAALNGFETEGDDNGIDIYIVNAWDYPALIETYQKGIRKMRETHRPALFHIKEVTQPQGHSTSGSHERYKSKERLEWEGEYDCLNKMRAWMLEHGIANEEELDDMEKEAQKEARQQKASAWKKYYDPIQEEISVALGILENLANDSSAGEAVLAVKNDLQNALTPIRKDIIKSAKKALRITKDEDTDARQQLMDWLENAIEENKERYNTHLYSQSKYNAMEVEAVPAEYSDDSPVLNGYEILNRFFDQAFQHHPEVLAFGEDLGKIGDVNQGFAGLQEKYGEARIFDTGIREATIIGQGIGMAMRGLRPIAEIQYLDYLIYGLQPIVDDLATLQYRSRGGQKAPMVIRTRGHRLEGIWHTGSPIGMILNSIRGVYLLTPRNMVQAAGLYNTMLQSDEPALLIECLNGYRLKEKLPDNLTEFTVPLGEPEFIREGADVTIISYGSTLKIVEEAIGQLDEFGISVELIDPQTLLPFDINHTIVESLKKTNRVVFVDEDVPGGATAYMMQEVLENQGGYFHLDSQPVTVSAMPHRSAYASDGDYFSKPNAEDIFEAVYKLMNEFEPDKYPLFY